MIKRQRLYLNLLILAGGLTLVLALLMALQRGGTSSSATTASAASPPIPSTVGTVSTLDVVATVDGEAISRAEWQKAVALDRAMSQLAGQPAPGVEATLDRLINGRLVLHQAGPKMTAQDSEASARLAQLEQSWRADDAAVDRALVSAGLTRQDLLAEIKRLLVVEAYLKQVSATQDPAAWLAAQRARAQIGIYADLNTPATPVAAPTPTPAPIPTQITNTREIASGSAPGQRAFDFALNDVNGRSVRLSDWRGRPVVINFWASWCPPCRQEMPALQAAYQRYREQGVIVLGVDLRENAGQVSQFASQFDVTYPLLLDHDGAVSERYQVRGIPTTIVLDDEGVIRARHVGPLTEDQFAEYVTPLLPASRLTPTARLAPDFRLPRENGEWVRLSDYRDKSSIVLIFYRGQT